MRVRVHTKDIKLTIPVPNALAFNHAVSLIASKALQKSVPSVQITPRQFDRFWMALREVRREWGKFSLVEVYTAGGEEIFVSL
ncbi:MAG: hypothetical protein DBY45_02565 [Clostridiales bacterium]|nr:MAG: hypothetical protein DBY45_02565 [Clostridiales bacterium]